jgi:hypothetical protein
MAVASVKREAIFIWLINDLKRMKPVFWLNNLWPVMS